MDFDAAGRLTKGLYAKKRKKAAPGESSKRAKVGSPSFEVPNIPTTGPEATLSVEVLSITEGNVDGEDPLPPAPLDLPAGGSMSNPLNERFGDDKKKKRAIVVKVAQKARPSGLSDNSSDDLGADPFDNPKIIRNLIDKFALSGEVDYLANLD
ncbi:hypothetical protein COCNU_01G021510 [Cocos nucifera]|uniref:Uncharacterized protein n=1 Tax=Cocos nucifera TaxID=13894 RepID=A0A8K0HX17_COCNU|nr:hypothetical protein COCNU_01G021510 [Cocos nucifera]